MIQKIKYFFSPKIKFNMLLDTPEKNQEVSNLRNEVIGDMYIKASKYRIKVSDKILLLFSKPVQLILLAKNKDNQELINKIKKYEIESEN